MGAHVTALDSRYPTTTVSDLGHRVSPCPAPASHFPRSDPVAPSARGERFARLRQKALRCASMSHKQSPRNRMPHRSRQKEFACGTSTIFMLLLSFASCQERGKRLLLSHDLESPPGRPIGVDACSDPVRVHHSVRDNDRSCLP